MTKAKGSNVDTKIHVIKDLENLDADSKNSALRALESGQILFLPEYYYKLSTDENLLLSNPELYSSKRKNLSFDCHKNNIGGLPSKINKELMHKCKNFMRNYFEFTKELTSNLLDKYTNHLQFGRTSYRPAEIQGRAYSRRKDDKLLHVDSFPSTPVHNRRILRIFCNINTNGKPRLWNIGEPFLTLLERFANDIPAYKYWKAKLLYKLGLTKSIRSPYDHYQLKLHDRMKLNDKYQTTVHKEHFNFPAQSTWIVFTDQVSHAALGGQQLLEQTFYLPIDAMANPKLSPLRYWQHYKNCPE